MSTAVIAMVLQAECNFTDEMSADDILKETIGKARNHWMATSESQCFDAAMVVAYAKMNDADKIRMKASTDQLKALNAAINGVPVDMEAVMSASDGIEVFPLMGMWRGTP